MVVGEGEIERPGAESGGGGCAGGGEAQHGGQFPDDVARHRYAVVQMLAVVSLANLALKRWLDGVF